MRHNALLLKILDSFIVLAATGKRPSREFQTSIKAFPEVFIYAII